MSQWIAGISLGHNSGICLLKDGEVIFSIEEERLSRRKYDAGPILCLMKVLEYTDKLDYLVISSLGNSDTFIEYTKEPLYQSIAIKLGLIERSKDDANSSNQVIQLQDNHHALHASVAFYNSGFESAVSVIVDSSGSSEILKSGSLSNEYFETESIFNCSYRNGIKPIYRKLMCDRGGESFYVPNFDNCELVVDEGAGIGKVFDAVTDYCGFTNKECGKTMGLAAFGSINNKIPNLFHSYDGCDFISSNKEFIKHFYPNNAKINLGKYGSLDIDDYNTDLTLSQNRRDLAFKVQKETEEQVLSLIIKASKMSNNKNVVLSGGYALNCVSNYHYLDKLNENNIKLFVEPNSSDAGTATGAALFHYHNINGNIDSIIRNDNLFLGPEYNYTIGEVMEVSSSYGASVSECSYKEAAKLIKEGNIVSIYQGRSENGPRALGNRSILFNPTIINGKDIVNKVKGREYFRPFAASVMKDYVHDWFDLKGMEDSPSMMYAVNVNKDKKDLIPSVLHVDDTCRIQTVNKEENINYYKLINEFYNITGVPMLFNTSFNLAGEPLVETIEDALEVLNNSDIEYCFLPELNSLIRLYNGKD